MVAESRQKPVKTRRLSPPRVLLAVAIVVSLVSGAVFGWREWRSDPTIMSNKPWYAPYVDVTAMPQFDFEQIASGTHKDAVLAFVVASKDDSCSPSWGGEYSINKASTELDLDRRIARLKQQGGSIAVSFGGLKNDELATKCSDAAKLYNAYSDIVKHYDLSTIDLDLEKDSLTDTIINVRRAQAIAKLQDERRAQGKPLAVWITLPVTSQGLNKDGTNVIKSFLDAEVDIAGINIMTMSYNEKEVAGKDMSDIAISSLNGTKRQLGILYDQAGTHLNNASLWRKIGVTPMIGQNSVKGEIFTVNDAHRLNKFTRDNGVGRMSMWSVNRDVECGTNYIDLTTVSNSCSGVKQERYEFTLALGSEFTGSIAGSAGNVTVNEDKPNAEDIKDTPENSPYPIWSKDGMYLQGAKIVWHRNVYQSKWWTKGDTPDNPVLQSWETPWELIGPVLPGEKPVKQAELPDGTYPEWSGDAAYETNQRVLFQGVPYKAKWWNRGSSPAAVAADANASPWEPLTQDEVNKIVSELGQ